MNNCSRRNFLYTTGAGALAGAASRASLYGQQEIPQALLAMDKEIGPAIKQKKYVVIKVNNVATNNQLAATHVDALRGILDYLAPRFKGPVMIVESSALETMDGFDNYKYAQLIPEYKRFHLKLVDLNREKKYEVFNIVDRPKRG